MEEGQPILQAQFSGFDGPTLDQLTEAQPALVAVDRATPRGRGAVVYRHPAVGLVRDGERVAASGPRRHLAPRPAAVVAVEAASRRTT